MNGCLNFIFSEKFVLMFEIILCAGFLFMLLENIICVFIEIYYLGFNFKNILRLFSNVMILISFIYVITYTHTDLYENRYITNCKNDIKIFEKKN